MAQFELLERDGLARLGRLQTPHGAIETPALLPVVHPDPARQPVPASEIRQRFGLGAVITSAYIAWRTPPLRAAAEERGIHSLLGFDGPVMTDSGAFQQHAYGHVEVRPEEILGFQRRIGSDIVTVLDIFGEPGESLETARRGVEETAARARAARGLHRGLLAVPVQGGPYPELRARSAELASQVGDVLAVGGVVPLLEQYRFVELARALLASRPALAPECPVHLFGTGHPLTFAFAALFGVDLFDSSAYHKFARRGALLFPEGTVAIEGLAERTCPCRLCESMELPKVARLPEPERSRRIAEHNLLSSAAEVGRVRQAIRDGTLWELVERRVAAHPALLAGLRATIRQPAVFLPTEPESRRSFRAVTPTSALRPAVIRYLARAQQYRAGGGELRTHPWVPLVPAQLAILPLAERSGAPVRWAALTPLGLVPLELTEIYPLSGWVGVEEFEASPARRHFGRDAPSPDLQGLEIEPGLDWTAVWTEFHARALLAWSYGHEASDALWRQELAGQRSVRTGRLRAITRGSATAFVVGADGLARPTWLGGQLLHRVLPAPAARIVVDPDAVEFVAAGRTLFSKFVRGGDGTLVPGRSALLVDPEDRLLAVGRLHLAPRVLARFVRGVAVHVTTHARQPQLSPERTVPPSSVEDGTVQDARTPGSSVPIDRDSG